MFTNLDEILYNIKQLAEVAKMHGLSEDKRRALAAGLASLAQDAIQEKMFPTDKKKKEGQ